MSEPAVLDWDRIVHKNVRSSDGQDAGNIDAVDADSIVIITEGARGDTRSQRHKSKGLTEQKSF